MNTIFDSLISGIIYDLIKSGVKLTHKKVFKNFLAANIIDASAKFDDFFKNINEKSSIKEKEDVINELLNSQYECF